MNLVYRAPLKEDEKDNRQVFPVALGAGSLVVNIYADTKEEAQEIAKNIHENIMKGKEHAQKEN